MRGSLCVAKREEICDKGAMPEFAHFTNMFSDKIDWGDTQTLGSTFNPHEP